MGISDSQRRSIVYPLMAAHSRELLAKRIVDLAQRGERDPTRLSDALAHLTEQSIDGRPEDEAR